MDKSLELMQGIISQSALGHFHSSRLSCEQRSKLKNSGSKTFSCSQQSYSESTFQHPTMSYSFIKHRVITIVITVLLIISVRAHPTFILWCPRWDDHMSRYHHTREGRCALLSQLLSRTPHHTKSVRTHLRTLVR